MDQCKGFCASLFDCSFSELITMRVIKVLYVLFVILAVLGVLGMIIGGFGQSAVKEIVTLILSPLILLLFVIFIRVYMELIVVVFKIEENTRSLRKEELVAAPPADPV